jgi:hypothetical protein
LESISANSSRFIYRRFDTMEPMTA